MLCGLVFKCHTTILLSSFQTASYIGIVAGYSSRLTIKRMLNSRLGKLLGPQNMSFNKINEVNLHNVNIFANLQSNS